MGPFEGPFLLPRVMLWMRRGIPPHMEGNPMTYISFDGFSAELRAELADTFGERALGIVISASGNIWIVG